MLLRLSWRISRFACPCLPGSATPASRAALCLPLVQIMRDLNVLVIDQGTILDRIDYNMEQVWARVVQLGKWTGQGGRGLGCDAGQQQA